MRKKEKSNPSAPEIPRRKQAEQEARGSHPWLSLSGLAGSFFSTLCCIGIAPLVSLVIAAGAGFLLNFAILLPALIVFLFLGGWSLWISYRRHGYRWPLALHVAGGAGILLLISTRWHGPFIWVGLATILAGALWNLRLEYLYWHRKPEITFPGAARPERG